jgi:hypothetical protein
MFIEFNMMITFFYFQETYNNRLKEGEIRERYFDPSGIRSGFVDGGWIVRWTR